jgi:hypothetical protein
MKMNDNFFDQVRKYLLEKDNMITDYVEDAFETVTGMKVSRKVRW